MRPSAALLVALLAALPTQLAAEILSLPAPQPAQATPAPPARGTSMAGVEARFGPPTRRLAAVGDPPITRWVYPGFVVYFEHDHVVHTISAVAAPPAP